MKTSKMKINKKLLSIKGHYFLFNAGTAPLVPYLSTYARQLGFSSATVGLIYTILPIFGLVAKPLFGIIADKYKLQKNIFILFQIITIVSFGAIYFIPGNKSPTSVELDCGNGVTMLKSCYKDAKTLNQDKINALGNENQTSKCKMNCDMNTPRMWQTVCEHWHIPQYCYSATDNILFKSHISNVTLKDDHCAYITANNVTLDGNTYIPHCRIGGTYKDINEPCSLDCDNSNISSLIGKEQVNITCINEQMHYRLCSNDTTAMNNLSKEPRSSDCKTKCQLDTGTPWRLMEICEGWHADEAASCHPKNALGETFPKNLTFVGSVLLPTTISEHACVYMQLHDIKLMDGSVHYPNCVPAQNKSIEQLFRSSCEITCDNSKLNEIFVETTEVQTRGSRQFWLFFLCMIVSWIGQAVVVTFADAICFNLLGEETSGYGRQRLWGSVGWGIFSFLTGILIDTFSDGAYKDYTVAFVLMFVFMLGDVFVSFTLKNEPTRMSLNIIADVGKLMSSFATVIFFFWTIAVGLCTGLLWNFLFWHIEDVAATTENGIDHVKTLQGLVSAIQTFAGEIPFLFVSGYLLKKIGHSNTMSLVLFAFGVRFILYSFLTSPWLILPIEMFQGITFGMFYPTMTSYANVVSPVGTETTVQGLTGAIFEGVGTSLGNLIGGILYDKYGGWNTFRWFGCGSLILCLVHAIVHHVFKEKMANSLPQEYASVIRYGQNDTVNIVDNLFDECEEESDY